MDSVSSRRSFFHFYVSLTGLFALFCFLSFAFISTFLQEISKGNKENKIYFLPLLGIALLIAAFYLLIRYHKNTPKIIITEKSIQVNRRFYKLSYIKDVTYTGRQKFEDMLPHYKEAAKITFTNGDVVFIYDELYENSSELKMYLDALLNPEKTVLSRPTSTKINIEGEHFYNYKKPLLFSLTGATFVLFSGFFLCMFIVFIVLHQHIASCFFLLILLIIYYFMSAQLYYFSINEKYLVVRNHVIFRKKIIYTLNDIKEIVLVPIENRAPNALRVITNNYKNKRYYAATLYDSDWQKLRDHLEKEGVNVRNELYF
ncbi:hypothetical protein FMM05_06565 [Flavobacterium zepuense]|uniref:PH domain-containing protein n=1 Tax=Flavobacterium zepuense TaxID=2593302 RepID=A0A552V600_9FLAO|nr:hypothetical protein [Flavobacterium zepuense]TRW25881.1 hypothetical protein FMM05_06565 [Flavobacterium zepuense]